MLDLSIRIFSIIVLISFVLYYVWYVFIIFLPKKKNNFNEDSSKYFHYLFIPCLDEEDVIYEGMVFWDSICKEYDNIQIFLINDDSSDKTKSIIENHIINKKYYTLIDRKKPNAQQGKGEALNDAYTHAIFDAKKNNYNLENCIITVFDADAFVKKEYFDFLEKFFSNINVSLVQARVSITGVSTWIELMQEIDFYTCIDGIQNIRSYIENVGAGGNGQSIRMSSISRKKFPWGNSLLEDYEFSTRLLLEGKETVYMSEYAVYQQGLKNYKQFIKQRGRWAQGGIQCLKYYNSIFNSKHFGILAKLEMLYFMILPFISIISLLAYVFLIYIQYSLKIELVISLQIILLINIIPGTIIGLKYYRQKSPKKNISGFIKYGFVGSSIIIYNYLLIPAQVLSIYRQLRGKSNWVKTKRQKNS